MKMIGSGGWKTMLTRGAPTTDMITKRAHRQRRRRYSADISGDADLAGTTCGFINLNHPIPDKLIRLLVLVENAELVLFVEDQ